MKRGHFYTISICCILLFAGCVSTRMDPPSQQGDSITLAQIRQSATAQTTDMVNFLSKAIQYQSVEAEEKGIKPETKNLITFVSDTAKEIGFTARLAANDSVLILEYGKGSESVGVLLHLDVVPVSEQGLEDWTHPPFSGKIADGSVWGRGAQDNKGALASTLWAVKILIDKNVHFKRQLRLILGTKEETSFDSLIQYFKEEGQPDYGIVPDGIFITQGEKGIADVFFDFPGLSTAEKDVKRDTVVHWQGGTVINTVPDFSFMVIKSKDVKATRAELNALIQFITKDLAEGSSKYFFGKTTPYKPQLSVSDYKTFVDTYKFENIPSGDLVLFSKGVATHGSAPWDGKNAIVEVSLVGAIMSQLSDNAFKRAMQFASFMVGVSVDGSGLVNKKGWGIPFIAPLKLPYPPAGILPLRYYGTSNNLGLAQALPNEDVFQLAIDFRTGLKNTNKQIMDHCQNSVQAFNGTAKLEGTYYESFYQPEDSFLLDLAVSSYKDVYNGRAPYLFTSPGSTYLKLVKNFINLGPVDLYPKPSVNHYHQKDEQVSIGSLNDNMILYAHILQKMLQIENAPITKNEMPP